MSDEWKEQKGGDVVTLAPGEKISGKYVSMEQSKKFPDSYGVKIDTPEGQKVIFANELLRQKIEDSGVMRGQEVMIIFEGLKKNETGTREYKLFQFFYR